MQRSSIPELDKLFIEIGTYRESTDLKELLDFIKKFPRVAPYNAMLLHVQKPGSQYVASVAEWKQKFNREIKPGARPLVILRPFGPVAFVFELGDTYGKDPFPEELLNPFKVEGEIANYQFAGLAERLKYDGVSYYEVEQGTGRAGMIRVSQNKIPQVIITTRKEIWVKTCYDMVVNRNHETTTKFATILHELGHLYCGHLGSPNEKWWKNRQNLSEEVREFEAECVCWLICERMGIKNPSAQYLNGYLNGSETIPDISIDTILRSAGIIETLIDGTKEIRKDIITSVIERTHG